MPEHDDRYSYLHILCLVIGITILWFFRGYFLAPEGWGRLAPDEAQRAWHALRVTNGEIPYRDFWVQYTPFSFYWHALLFKIFGPSLHSIRIGLFVCGSLLLLLLFSITRKLAGGFSPVLAMTLFVSFGILCYNSGYPAWYAMAFSMGSLALLLRSRPNKFSTVLAGMLAGMAVLTKVNIGVFSFLAFMVVLSSHLTTVYRIGISSMCFIAVSWLLRGVPSATSIPQFLLPLGLVLFAFSRCGDDTHRIPTSHLGLGIGGFAAAAVIGSLPFLNAVGFQGLWSAFITEPLRFAPHIAYHSPIWSLSKLTYVTAIVWVAAVFVCRFHHEKWYLCGAIILLGVLPFLAEAITLSRRFYISAGFRFLLIPILLIGTAVFLLRRDRSIRKPLIAVVAVWTAFTAIQVHPGQNNMHIAWAYVAVWPLLSAIGSLSGKHRFHGILIVLPLSLCLAQLSGDMAQLKHIHWTRLDVDRGGILIPAKDTGPIENVLNELNDLPPQTPVLDLTSGCLMAFLAERSCPLRHGYFWFRFLTESAQSTEVALLEKEPPPVAVRRSKGGSQFRWDSIRQYAPILGSWVDETYEVVNTIGPYEILLKTGRRLPG